MATDHVRLAFFGIFFGMIANIILALVLVPVFGLIGAASASLCYILISVLFEYRYLSRIVPILFEKSRIARIVSAAIAMGILLMIVDEFLNMSGVAKPIMMIIIGSLIYFTLLSLMDSQLREDAMRIVKINWLAR
jgi:O-antigen/teichoic acid export membrane protein